MVRFAGGDASPADSPGVVSNRPGTRPNRLPPHYRHDAGPADTPDAALLERLRDASDGDAWREFVDRYQPLLLAWVRVRGVRPSDAPDVVQDILARLVPALTRFRLDPARGQFRHWLWRVTYNTAANWIRRRAAWARAEDGWRERRDTDPPDGGPDDREDRRRRTLTAVLEEVRCETTPLTWSCFAGRLLTGRPGADVAAELGVSANSVYVNTCRVLARVRTRYGSRLGGPEADEDLAAQSASPDW